MDNKLISLFLWSLCITTTQQKLYSCNSNASCGCSQNSASVDARIINGESASVRTWSWAVSLRISGSLCGGSIISDSYIMTAGHCVEDISAYSITVYVGSIRLFEGDALTVSRIYLHPFYYVPPSEEYILHDIALLKLSQPLSSTNKIWAEVCLPKYNIILTDNTNLTAIGWGITKEESQDVSETLQQVTVKLINSDTAWCRNIARNASIQFCAGVMPYGGKDACQGDSGGPLMHFNDDNQWEVQGVTSYGYGCGRQGKPGVYTRVGYYLDWIKHIVENDPATTITTATTLSNATSKKLNVFLICLITFIMFG